MASAPLPPAGAEAQFVGEGLAGASPPCNDGPASSRRSRSSPSSSGGGGDWNVCTKVLREYLPLVYQVVSSMARRLPANVLRDDLVAAGVFGLVDSIRKNGGDRGGGFEWYARTRIRGAIVDELRAQDWLPRRARRAASASAPGATALRSVVVSVEDVAGLEQVLHAAMVTEDPLERIEARSEHRALARAIEQLPERERRIVGMHYFSGLRFKDIGAELGVSEPRISQLHARALDRLRGLLEAA